MFTRIRRFATILAAVATGLLASAAIVPAAFATVTPIGNDGPATPTTGAAPVLATTVHVITTGGMAGWQIAAIALGSAVIAAAAAVLLYRALAARRSPAATA